MVKKPQATFLIRLHGGKVLPENVPVRALAEIVSSVQALTVDDVVFPKISTFEQFYEEIRSASGNAWDDVDSISEELESMR